MTNQDKSSIAGQIRWLLLAISENPDILEIGREAIEDELLLLRINRMSQPMRGNGLVIREKNGQGSDTIRMGPEEALRIGLRAMAKDLQKYIEPDALGAAAFHKSG